MSNSTATAANHKQTIAIPNALDRLVRSARTMGLVAVTLTLLFVGAGCSDDNPLAPDAPAPTPEVHSVEIQNAPFALESGASVQLTAAVQADDGVEDHGVLWSSSSPELLHVADNGMLTAVAPGNVEVTARSRADESTFDQVRVTVTSPDATIIGVSIDPVSEELYFGNHLALSATVSGTGSFAPGVSWRSNRPHIASVDAQGLVTAEAVGTVEITAESNSDPTKSEQLTLEVRPARITEVLLDATQNEMLTETTQSLSLTVNSLGQIDTSVYWATSDAAVATVDDSGNVSGHTIGSVTITATSNADPNRWGSVSIFVDTPDLSGLVKLMNVETNRLLFSAGDPAQGEGNEGGWLQSPTVVGADANYYNRALWQLTKLADGTYLLKNSETQRYVFDPSDALEGPDGSEGGWLESQTILGADANYYGRAVWNLVETGSGTYFLRNAVTNRYLLSTGNPAEGEGNEGGWLESPTMVGADANYYNRAMWEIVR